MGKFQRLLWDNSREACSTGLYSDGRTETPLGADAGQYILPYSSSLADPSSLASFQQWPPGKRLPLLDSLDPSVSSYILCF